MDYFVLKTFRLPNLTNHTPETKSSVTTVDRFGVRQQVSIDITYTGSDIHAFFEETFDLVQIIHYSGLDIDKTYLSDFPKNFILEVKYTKDDNFLFRILLINS